MMLSYSERVQRWDKYAKNTKMIFWNSVFASETRKLQCQKIAYMTYVSS